MVAPVITADVPRFESYTASGGQTVFPITCAYFAETDVRVQVMRDGDVVAEYAGGDGDMTCSPTADAALVDGVAGAATIPACEAGDVVTVYTETTPERSVSYTNPADATKVNLNAEMNRRVAVEIELREQIARAPKVGFGEEPSPELLANVSQIALQADNLAVLGPIAAAIATAAADIVAILEVAGNTSAIQQLAALITGGSLGAGTLAIKFIRDYLPADVRAAVAAGTNTADLRVYLQAAIDDAAGKWLIGTPKDNYRIAASVYANAADTKIDLNGATIEIRSGLQNAAIWITADRCTVRGGRITSTLSIRHAAIQLGRLNNIPTATMEDCTIENMRFEASSGFGLIGVQVRTKGVKRLAVDNNTGDGIRELVYIDCHEDQNWRAYYQKNSPAGGLTTLNTATGGDVVNFNEGSIQTRINAGDSWGVVLVKTSDANLTFRLWGDESEISILAGVITFNLSGGPGLPAGYDEIRVFTWTPAIAPADDLDGLFIRNNRITRIKETAVRINCPMRAAHKRTPLVDGVKNVVISGNYFDQPDSGSMLTVWNGSTEVICANGVTNCLIIGNMIPRAYKQGFHVEDCTGRVVMTNNTLGEAGEIGYYVTNTLGASVTGNFGAKCKGFGFYFDFEDPAPPNLEQSIVTNKITSVLGNEYDAANDADCQGGFFISGTEGGNIVFDFRGNTAWRVTKVGTAAFEIAGTARGIGLNGDNHDIDCRHRIRINGISLGWYDQGGISTGRTNEKIIFNSGFGSFGVFHEYGRQKLDLGTVTIAGGGSSSAITLGDIGDGPCWVDVTLSAVRTTSTYETVTTTQRVWWDGVAMEFPHTEDGGTAGLWTLSMSGSLLQAVLTNTTGGSITYHLTGQLEANITHTAATAA